MARRRKRRTLKPRMPKRVKRKRRAAQDARTPASRADRARARRAGRVSRRGALDRLERGVRGRLDRRRRSTALVGAAALALPAALVIRRPADGRQERPRRGPPVPHRAGRALGRAPDHARQARAAATSGRLSAAGSASRSAGRAWPSSARSRCSRALLLLTGASIGAILRRSTTRVIESRAERSRRRAERVPPLRVIEGAAPDLAQKPLAPPVDGENEFPDVVAASEPPPLLVAEPELEDEPDQESLFDVTAEPAPDYRLPDRELLRASPPGSGPNADHGARIAEALVQTLANFGVDATVVGQISGPRVTRYELQLAPGTKVSKVAALKDDLSYALATTEIRILAPIPGKQAVGVELPEPEPEPRHARRHLRRPAADREPALGLARQGHLRPGGLDRPRADAAHPDRRHDRLGQVGLHQHDPDLGAPARDPGRRADDPDRPEADRARLLRVDPAPPDAGRLEPEGGGGRAPERRRRDGAPLRAALGGPRAQPPRGEPRLPLARRGSSCRTCSS